MSTVREHFLAIDPDTPEWKIILGEYIERVAKCPAALAMGRALDLSTHEKLALGIKSLVEGWMLITEHGDNAQLTQNQKSTVRDLLTSMLDATKNKFK